MKVSLSTFVLLSLASALVVPASDDAGAVFYREKVFPILEQSCFKCHGGGDRLKGEFRVTSREGLLRGGEYGPGYDEADPGKSLLLEMVSYRDENYQMPPKAKLPPEQLDVLREWILMGAPYDPDLEIEGEASERHRGFTVTEEDRDWWAYRPVAGANPPEVGDRSWGVNGIDAFILSGLESAGLTPNQEAAPGVLIRRVTYDLAGLPPSPESVERFQEDYRADPAAAYDALIERLLASPRYGEKWARHWLDLVRYAESNGFERDNSKPEIWKYRDYVVDAFNADLPYDRFVIEQLAGDEVEDRTRDSLAATGYHRLMQWDDEPADRKQHVYDLLADNVQITSETFLGTTLGCARCHDHKADPFSQKDYYAFMSFFHGVTHYQTPGTIHHWASEEDRRAFEEKRKGETARLEREIASLDERVRSFLIAEKLIQRQGRVKDQIFVRDGRRENPATWEYTTKRPTPDWKEVGFRDKMWSKGAGGLGGNVPNNVTRTRWAADEIWMRTNFGLKEIPGTLALEIYHDEDVEVYLNGVEIFRAAGYLTDYSYVPLGEEARAALQTGRNVLAIHCRNKGGGQYIDAGLRTVASDSRKLEDIVRVNGDRKLVARIEKHFGEDVFQQYLNRKKALDDWGKRKAGEPLNVVMERGAQPPPMHVHLRGSAHALGDEVAPGFPAVLGGDSSEPVPASWESVSWEGGATSGRRLALARWMVSGDNPLVARVMVNRIWQHHFGRGIVPSSSDFGKLGEKPTHPELLDWLAAEFRDGGWRIKELHRLILKSRTYRMSSEPNSANLEIDPANHLFWRNNMRRLTAEEVRDSILAVSGKLENRLGGPWVYPPLPEEVLATASRPGKGWPISRNEKDHYRRSLYIHVKRSLRHPMMTDFDQADTDSPCAVRFATTVPAQALMMLNSKFVNDQAEELAKSLRGAEGDDRARIARALRLVTQRSPEEGDVDRCVDLFRRFQTEAGLSRDESLNRIALLALNLNEFMYLD